MKQNDYKRHFSMFDGRRLGIDGKMCFCIENGCWLRAGGYTVIFPFGRDDFFKMLKEEGIIRYGCLEVNKLIEFLKYSSGTNVLDD